MKTAYWVIALCLCGLASLPAQAQTTAQQPTYYVVPSGGAANSSGSLFNQNAQPLPLQQMIAGQNAPSYNYGGTQAYTGSSSRNTSIGVMSPAEARAYNQQREANALAYQNQYLASLGQSAMGQQQPTNSSAYQGSAYSKLYANSQEKKVPTKRRVLYKSMNDPLAAPPRLFNID